MNKAYLGEDMSDTILRNSTRGSETKRATVLFPCRTSGGESDGVECGIRPTPITLITHVN